MQDIVLKQNGKWMSADIQTPISLFLGLVGTKQGILLESAEVDGRFGRFSVIAWNFRLRLSCKAGKLEVAVRDDRLEPLRELAGMDFVEGVRAVMARLHIEPAEGFEDLPPITRGLYGYFGFGMAGLFEPKLLPLMPVEHTEACLVLPGSGWRFSTTSSTSCACSRSWTASRRP